MRIAKGHVESMLGRFWDERRVRSKLDGGQLAAMQSLQDFFLDWLQRQTQSHAAAIEMAYNICDVCERYKSDPDCGLFLSALNKQTSEQVIYNQRAVVETLRLAVQNADKERCGTLKRVVFHRLLRKLFPAKTSDDMLRLRYTLAAFAKGSSVVSYHALFEEDDEGNQTKFVELLRLQDVRELQQFAVDVEECLRDIIRDGSISLLQAVTAIKSLDPAKPNDECDRIVAFGSGFDPSGFAVTSVPAEEFLERIRCGYLLKRHTRVSEEENKRVQDLLANQEQDESGLDDDDEADDADSPPLSGEEGGGRLQEEEDDS
jgi:hypothetical protein